MEKLAGKSDFLLWSHLFEHKALANGVLHVMKPDDATGNCSETLQILTKQWIAEIIQPSRRESDTETGVDPLETPASTIQEPENDHIGSSDVARPTKEDEKRAMRMILDSVCPEIGEAIRLNGCRSAAAAYAFVVQQYMPDPRQVVHDTTQALKVLKYCKPHKDYASGMTVYLNKHREHALKFRMIHLPYSNSLMAEHVFAGLPDNFAEWILNYKLDHVLGSKSADYDMDHLARCLLDEEHRLKK